VRTTKYDAIFVCNEEILEGILTLPDYTDWRGLVISSKPTLQNALSKLTMLQVAKEVQVATPRTIFCRDEKELRIIAEELGFPLIVKGDRGESGQHVRLVLEPDALVSAFREINALEPGSYVGPAIQEYVKGPAYSVGGLFHHGRPLRVCAHRKLIAIPPLGGLTVSGVTERCPGLLEEAFKIFAALEYTGLGHLELIKHPDGRFRFLEINPRVWGTNGVAEYAGVDLFGPYLDLARGVIPDPDLRFREGVRFHRIVREGRMIGTRPSRIPGLLKDMFDPRVRSDFTWSDPLPHLIALTTGRARAASPAAGSDG
jgi:biotin carboxylase